MYLQNNIIILLYIYRKNSINSIMTGSCGMSNQEGGAKKRKLTPYNKFVKKMYKELHKKYPNDSAPQIMKKIGVEWKKTKK